MKFLHGVSLRRSFAVGVAALFMGLVLYSLGETEEAAPEAQPLAVSIARAAMVERSTGLRLTGTVEGLTSAIISSRYSGQVEEVNVENGQRVYAGQPLFRTDSRELENNLRIAQNGVRKAKVNFDNIDTNYQRNQKLFEIGAVSKQSMESNVTQREVTSTLLTLVVIPCLYSLLHSWLGNAMEMEKERNTNASAVLPMR